MKPQKAQIFFCYANEDKPKVIEVYYKLKAVGFAPWLDEIDLLPGQNKTLEIPKVIRSSNFILLFFSSISISKRGQVQKQLKLVLETIKEIPEDQIFVIPIRLDSCPIPVEFEHIQYLDLFEEGSIELVVKTIKSQRLASEDEKNTLNTIDTLTHIPTVWNIPQLRNPNFIGREKVLKELFTALNSGEAATLTQAITGLGGIGKTQIALEYIYQHASAYDIVWWLRSEEPETLAADYAALARELKLKEKDQTEQAIVISAVRRWLEQHTGWLLVFDNASTPNSLREYLPRNTYAQIIITSRYRDWGDLGCSIAVPTWSRKEALDFLLKRTGQGMSHAASRLCQKLGDLPLALEQAAAYMLTSKINFQDYLNLFRTRRKDLLQQEKSPANYHQENVATTWSLALEEIKKTAPIGVNILNLCAYFAPDNIPRSLLDEAAKFLKEEIAIDFRDPLIINQGIQALNHYSLVDITTNTLSIHRLVQAIIQDHLDAESQNMWVHVAIQILNDCFPRSGFNNFHSWSDCIVLLPHAQLVAEYAIDHHSNTAEAASLLNKVASYLHGRAAYGDAEILCRRALKIVEKELGPEHIEVSNSLNNLTGILQDQAQYSDAEILCRRALKIRKLHLGAEHPLVAKSLNNLAGVLKAQGKNNDAELVCRKALKISELQFGIKKPDVAQKGSDMIPLLTFKNQINNEEGPYQQRFWQTSEVARSLSNLVGLLAFRGRLSDAENLCKRALEISERHFGPEHPGVASCMNSMARVLAAQGKLIEAEELSRRALKISETWLGPENPRVANYLSSLADVQQDQGKYSDAEQLIRKALKIRETVLGSEHPLVANGLNRLAGLLQDQGKYSDAERLFRQALKICKTVLGKDHPKTISVLKNLNNLLDK